MTNPALYPRSNPNLSFKDRAEKVVASPSSPYDRANQSFEDRSDRLMSRMLTPEARQAARKISFTNTYRRNSR